MIRALARRAGLSLTGRMRLETDEYLSHRPVMARRYSIELQRSKPCRMTLPYRRWYAVSFYPDRVARIERSGAWGTHADAFEAGSLGVYPAGEPEAMCWRGETEALHVHIEPRLVEEARHKAGAPGGSGIERAFQSGDRVLKGLAADLYDAVRAGAGEETCEPLIHAIVGRLAEGPDAPRPLTQPSIGRLLLDDVLDAMHGPASTNQSVARLAARAGLNRHHFTRRFTALFGASPHDYLLRNRIETAKSLISQGESAAVAAVECGFFDQSHFTKTFRARTGLTPGAFADYFGL